MLVLFFCLVALIGVTRLIELYISRQHRELLFQSGALDVPERGFPVMVALHVGILIGCISEVLFFSRLVPTWLGLVAASGVILANALRIWAIVSLGVHWNVRVVDSMNQGVVTIGPYHWIRHPNYVAVFVELTLLPLVQGAWITAACGTALHVLVLLRRIVLEERVLMKNQNYRQAMEEKPRFLPMGGKWPTSTAM